jgi:hypothetical protein
VCGQKALMINKLRKEAKKNRRKRSTEKKKKTKMSEVHNAAWVEL